MPARPGAKHPWGGSPCAWLCKYLLLQNLFLLSKLPSSLPSNTVWTHILSHTYSYTKKWINAWTILHAHRKYTLSQPSWMKGHTEQTIRGRKGNMPSGQAITSYHVGGNPICSLVQRLWEHFGGVNYFSHLLTGCNCSRTGDNVYSCSHALTAFHLCASLLNIYLCTSPSCSDLQIHGGTFTTALQHWIHRCNLTQIFSSSLCISLTVMFPISEATWLLQPTKTWLD